MTTIRTRAAKGSALSATEYDDAVKRTPVVKSSNYTLDASHNREVHELGGSITTVTLPSVSPSFSETGDWRVTLISLLNTPISIDRNGQTIDGASANLFLPGKGRLTLFMNSSFDGFWSDKQIDYPYYACRAYKTSNQSHPTSNSWVDVTFDAESFDSGDIHDTSSNTELFTAPGWATTAKITAHIAFDANSTGVRGVRLVTSAGAFLTPHVVMVVPAVSLASINTFINLNSGIVPVTGGSSYKVQAYQTSGGALNILGTSNETWVSIEFLP